MMLDMDHLYLSFYLLVPRDPIPDQTQINGKPVISIGQKFQTAHSAFPLLLPVIQKFLKSFITPNHRVLGSFSGLTLEFEPSDFRPRSSLMAFSNLELSFSLDKNVLMLP